MRHPRRLFAAALAAALVGCAEPPTASQPAAELRTPQPSKPASTAALPPGQWEVAPGASATPTPRPLRLEATFEDVGLGDAPKDWVDVATETAVPSWVYAGNWRVVDDGRGNHVFMHDDVRDQPAVSFQRYRGDALGTTDGRLPNRYYAEVAMRPIESPHNYPPTGDQGVQFYYLGTGRYLEIVIKPTFIEVWEADGAEPKTSKGWKRVWGQALQTKGGDLRRIGALVDVEAGTFETFLDGKRLSTIKSPLLKPQPAWLTLRGIGNVVSFDDVVIEPR